MKIARTTAWMLRLTAIIVVVGAMASGTITGADEDIPSALIVLAGTLPTTLIIGIGACWVWPGVRHKLACLVFAACPILALFASCGWIRLNTAVFGPQVAMVRTTEWNARADETIGLPNTLVPEGVCVYHWSPLFRRIAVLNDRGEPNVVVDIERRAGHLVVTGATCVNWASSGNTGVWPNR